MNIDGAFPSNYLKSSDIEGEVTKKIRGVKVEDVGQGDEQESKPVLYFADEHKTKMVLNKTNANVLKEMLGSETDDWKGKEIVLHVKKVQFGANMVDGLRIKFEDSPKPNAVAGAADDDIPF